MIIVYIYQPLLTSILFSSIHDYLIFSYPWLLLSQIFRLAANARNFGASYLRLEDYYCYAASALEAVAEVSDLSALIPFDAKPIPL